MDWILSSPREAFTTQGLTVLLKRLHGCLVEVTRNDARTVAVKTSEAAKMLTTVGEALVWCDKQKRADFFELFFESKEHVMMLDAFPKKNEEVSIAILRLFNVLMENVQQHDVLYYLFSNNYINLVIKWSYDFSSEEVLSYYITLLKNLSIKLNAKTINLLFNDDEFPLFSEAVKYYDHENSMIRTGARTVTLNVLRVNNQQMTTYVVKKRHYFAHIVGLLDQKFTACSTDLEKSHETSALDEMIDELLYIQDIFHLGFIALNRSLAETIIRSFIVPTLISAVHAGGSLFLLSQVMLLLSYGPLVNMVVDLVVGILVESANWDYAMMPVEVQSRSGAVRAGSGGLFDAPDVTPPRKSTGSLADMGPRKSIGGLSQPDETKPANETRVAVLGILETRDSEIDVTLTLALLLSILRSKQVTSDTLQRANLYPRRSAKSKLLMEALMSGDTDSGTSAGEQLGYDARLVSCLIGIIGSENASTLRWITVEMAARCLITMTATGGVKLAGLSSPQMESLLTIRAKWAQVLMDDIESDSELVYKLLNHESKYLLASSLNIDKVLQDQRLLLPPPLAAVPASDIRIRYTSRSVRMVLTILECIKELGINVETIPADLIYPPIGTLVPLNARSITPCMAQLDVKTAPINGYFIFDPDCFILVEADRVVLGKGRIRDCRSICDVEVRYAFDFWPLKIRKAFKRGDTFTVDVESLPLEFASDSERGTANEGNGGSPFEVTGLAADEGLLEEGWNGTPSQPTGSSVRGGAFFRISLTECIKQLTGRVFEGIWHTSIVAFGKEIHFGEGIKIDEIGRTQHGQPVRVIDMGVTEIPREMFFEYLDEVRPLWTADKYHLFNNNCNTFTRQVCQFLVGKEIPSEIADLPQEFLSTPFGQQLAPVIEQMFNPSRISAEHAPDFNASPLMQAMNSVAPVSAQARHPAPMAAIPALSFPLDPALYTGSSNVDLIFGKLKEAIARNNIHINLAKVDAIAEELRRKTGDDLNLPAGWNETVGALLDLPIVDCLPLLDILRILVLDRKVSKYYIESSAGEPLMRLIYRLACDDFKSSPKGVRLMMCRLTANLFAFDNSAATYLSSSHSLKDDTHTTYRSIVTAAAIECLFDVDQAVSTCGASLMFNICARGLRNLPSGTDALLDEWALEVVAAIVRGLEVHQVEDIQLRLLSALRILLHGGNNHYKSLVSDLGSDVLQSVQATPGWPNKDKIDGLTNEILSLIIKQ
ncbi:Protein CL16A [Irineochytrium annulatum]|nr:Protein CL16A [Irineochytrium annulatum]